MDSAERRSRRSVQRKAQDDLTSLRIRDVPIALFEGQTGTLCLSLIPRIVANGRKATCYSQEQRRCTYKSRRAEERFRRREVLNV